MITAVSDPRPPPPASTASPLALIRKGWREVRDSAGADLQLMRDRASTFRELATSIDRELENLDLVKRIQPKLSEFRRAYSSPDFSQSVLRRWTAADGGSGDRGGRILRLDLSAIRNAFASEVEDGARLAEWERGFRAWDWRGEREEWEPIRRLKSGLRQLERRRSSSSSDFLVSLKNIEFVEKLKTRLVSKLVCN